MATADDDDDDVPKQTFRHKDSSGWCEYPKGFYAFRVFHNLPGRIKTQSTSETISIKFEYYCKMEWFRLISVQIVLLQVDSIDRPVACDSPPCY